MSMLKLKKHLNLLTCNSSGRGGFLFLKVIRFDFDKSLKKLINDLIKVWFSMKPDHISDLIF